MGLFENLPYTNFHRANLAWVLDTVKKLDKDFQDLDDYVKNYFENLDLSDDIEEILDIWYDDGRMATLMGLDFIRTYNTMTDMQHDTELQEGMVGMTKGFSSALDGLAGNYLVRAAGVGVTLDNGLIAVPISEDGSINLGLFGASGDITQLLAYCLGRYNRIHIPAGTYAISDRLTHSGDLVLTADKDALIVATITPSGSDAVAIRITDAQTVDISGGLWRYTTFNPSPISKALCHDYALIKAQRCVNVDIHDIACDMAVNGQMFAYDRCQSVSGHDADISFGSASGFIVQNGAKTAKFWNITASDFDNPYVSSGTPERWCYPISAGVYDLGAQIPMIESMTIENCTAKDCGWEAFDSHCARNFTIRNCSAYNCYRFFGAYQEGNFSSATHGGTLLIENCNFINDAAFTMGQLWAMNDSSGYHFDLIKMQNTQIVGKPSGFVKLTYSKVVFDSCIIDLLGATSGGGNYRNIYLTDSVVTFQNCTLRNFGRTSYGNIYAERCILNVSGCQYETDDGKSLLYAIGHDWATLVNWDRVGGCIYLSSGTPQMRGIVNTTDSDGMLVYGGSLLYGSGSAHILGNIYNVSANGLGAYGFGAFYKGTTAHTFTIPATYGEKVVDIGLAAFESAPIYCVTGLVFDGDENGTTVRNAVISKQFVWTQNGPAIRLVFAKAFTVTGDVVCTPVNANRETWVTPTP